MQRLMLMICCVVDVDGNHKSSWVSTETDAHELFIVAAVRVADVEGDENSMVLWA